MISKWLQMLKRCWKYGIGFGILILLVILVFIDGERRKVRFIASVARAERLNSLDSLSRKREMKI